MTTEAEIRVKVSIKQGMPNTASQPPEATRKKRHLPYRF